MAADHELQVQQKREVESKEESTMPARLFQPQTDIFETSEALTLVLEMPGVDKSHVDAVVARIQSERMKPVRRSARASCQKRQVSVR